MLRHRLRVPTRVRVAALLVLTAAILAGCNTDRGGPSPFTGFNFGATAGGAGAGRDAYGRRVDLDGPSTAPSLPSMGTPGLGK